MGQNADDNAVGVRSKSPKILAKLLQGSLCSFSSGAANGGGE